MENALAVRTCHNRPTVRRIALKTSAGERLALEEALRELKLHGMATMSGGRRRVEFCAGAGEPESICHAGPSKGKQPDHGSDLEVSGPRR